MSYQQVNIGNLTHDERVRVSVMIIDILDSWQVSPADQVSLLGLPESTRPRALKRYHEGILPLPEDFSVWERVSHLAGIADALRTSYPRNIHMGGVWLKRNHTRFGNRAPLTAMLEDGIHGINAVRMHLDCSYDWHVDEQVAAARREH